MEMMFKLNSIVKVKINDIGLSMLKNQHENIYGNRKEFVAPSVDENGYSEMKLWDLMMSFGDSVFYEGTLEDERWIPIDPVIIIDDKNFVLIREDEEMTLKKSKR